MNPVFHRLPALLATALLAAVPAAAAEPLPPLADLIPLLRTNLASLTDDQFDQAAGEALLERFRGRILAPGAAAETDPDAPAVASRRRLETPAAAIRIGQVRMALAPQLTAALADTNLMAGIQGLILDLRFAGGSDYGAAVAAAGLFLREPQGVLDWGQGLREVPGNPEAYDGPVIVLVNPETSGAAEALAAALQKTRTALLIGRPTSGQAAVFREIDLPDGRRLRLPVARVATGDGTPIPETGVVPDIAVRVNPDHERAHVEDPFQPAPGAAAGATARRRNLTEADLVRARREGRRPEAAEPAADGDRAASSPVVHDPVLARALDLLQGLQLLKPATGD